MKASDYIVQFIAKHGVDTIFGYQGGMITHLVDSIGNSKDVQYIQTYHEQTASIAAEGYAIESDKFGVAIATSGPGATNMMTGIADAYFGSIPVIYITGQVNTYEYKYNKPIRQQGFQETDIVSIVKPITKYAVLLDNADNIKYELEKALYIATHGRKGPVVIDLPMNISRAEIEPDKLNAYKPEKEITTEWDISGVIDLLEKSERPMLLLGAGCIGNESYNLINQLIAKSKIPVVTSLMGRGATDETYINYVGMIGSYGNRCANMAISKTDLLIVLGSRLDTRQTGARYEDFLREGKIIHVDIDNNELVNHRLNNRICIHTTINDFLTELLKYDIQYQDYSLWNNWVLKIKDNYSQDKEIERFVDNKAPYRLMQKLNEITHENDVITVDVGQNEMWAAQTIQLKKNQRFICSGGLAPMGFSLPVAIGVAFANRNKEIYAIVGDGGLHMSVQSLLLISQYHLKIKVILMNNSSLGMITQFQHLYFNDNMYGTTSNGGYLLPDIYQLALAYGLSFHKMNSSNLCLLDSLKDTNYLLDYEIDGLTTVCPKLEYNKPIEKPIPLLPEDEFNNIMHSLN